MSKKTLKSGSILDSWDILDSNDLMVSKKIKKPVIARNGEMKRSNVFNWLLMVRLLPPDQVRGRNDIFLGFLRDHHDLRCK